ncbi:MAG: hypothetical protein KF752_18565 [Pirellulaceae bacterium]|nr:hypothetical protein [Pirellulaceae bacterium]
MMDIKCHHRLGSNPTRHFHSTIAMAILIACAGCGGGPKLHKVTGTVNVDGKPAGGVGLTMYKFGTNEFVSSAVSSSDGSFQPFSIWENESLPGIPAGKYSIAATYPDPKFKAPKTTMGATPPDPPDLFNGKYALASSNVTIEIESDASAPVVELSTKK